MLSISSGSIGVQAVKNMTRARASVRIRKRVDFICISFDIGVRMYDQTSSAWHIQRGNGNHALPRIPPSSRRGETGENRMERASA